jgi:hypothetical protein
MEPFLLLAVAAWLIARKKNQQGSVNDSPVVDQVPPVTSHVDEIAQQPIQNAQEALSQQNIGPQAGATSFPFQNNNHISGL